MQVTKELCLGIRKSVKLNVLDVCKYINTDTIEEYPYFSKTTYECEHNGHKFTIVKNSALMGIPNVDIILEQDEFPSKAALIRFYREIKRIAVEVD